MDFLTIAGDLLLESCVPEVLFTIERDFTIEGLTNAGSLLYNDIFLKFYFQKLKLGDKDQTADGKRRELPQQADLLVVS